MFSLQSFTPHNYSLNLNLAIISDHSSSQALERNVLALNQSFANNLLSFFNCVNQTKTDVQKKKKDIFFAVVVVTAEAHL